MGKKDHPVIRSTSHVCINAKRMDEMLEFYSEKLQFTVCGSLTFRDFYDLVDRDEDPAAPKHLLPSLREKGEQLWSVNLEYAPGQYLELFYPTDDKEELADRDRYFGYEHMAFDVADIHAAYEWVLSRGIEPFRSIHQAADGMYSFWIRDPDGNPMEFVQR